MHEVPCHRLVKGICFKCIANHLEVFDCDDSFRDRLGVGVASHLGCLDMREQSLSDPTGDKAVPDPFFEVIYDRQWNACVGTQGDELYYVKGYLEAAQELVSAVIDKKLMASRDTLAMPILYNCRHGLEISLKFAINHLHRIGAINKRHRPNHDILSHWNHLRDARVGDSSIRRLVAELEPFVISLAKIDDDGQELRYAENREGQKSLGGHAVVNLPHIRASLKSMSEILARLNDRVMDLEVERSTRTHTSDCSRSDLKVIAEMLGDHGSWKDESFGDKKAAVRARFGLSSGTFSDAVTKIRNSRELAALVGLESELVYLSDEKAAFALNKWVKANSECTMRSFGLGAEYSGFDWEEISEHNRVQRELREAIVARLTVEEFSDLEVLFYIGRDQEFGECYNDMVLQMVSKNRLTEPWWIAVNHIMSKTNILESVIRGSKIAGRPTLAAKLRAMWPSIDRMGQERNGDFRN